MKGKAKSYNVEEMSFHSRGTRCGARLYRPAGVGTPPLVVMAHGFGGEMEWGLPAFASRFAGAGLAVFMFDYRNFGSSDGEPRRLVSPRRHRRDWASALEFARTIPGVDAGRMALWGTSFGGGHVLMTASRTPGIRALVAQVPHVDGFAAFRATPWGKIFRGSLAAFRDILRMATFRTPYEIKIAGSPDELAVLNGPDTVEGVMSIIPEGSPFVNACPARILFTAPMYRPVSRVKKIACPALIIIAEKDTLIPPESAKRAAGRMRNCETRVYDVAHFEPYTGVVFESVVKEETDFLLKHLK